MPIPASPSTCSDPAASLGADGLEAFSSEASSVALPTKEAPLRDRAAGRSPTTDEAEPGIGAERHLVDWLDGLRFGCVAEQSLGRRAEQDLSGQRRLLEPHREVDGDPGRERLPGRGVPREHLACIDSDPHAQGEPVIALQFLVQPGERLPEVGRRADGSRSASSSCSRGTPNTAMAASPMNFSTVPPWRSTIVRTVSK